jgi:predicted TIM-barrel fold metal-dependent hydrolase
MLDVFSHFTPRPILDRFQAVAPGLPALRAFERLPELWDLDARLRSLDGFDDLQQILNMGNPPVDALGPPVVAVDLAARANDEMAAVASAHPDRFPAFTACLALSDVDAALAEIDRAVGDLGARGIQLYTNVNGRPLSDPRFRPVFARMAELDLPVLIHPYRGPDVADYPGEDASQAELWFTFGWPYETTACATRLVYSGLFDELPDAKVVLHHMGAMIPFFAGRIALGFEQIFAGPGGANPVAERAGLHGPPIDHYRRFYADSAVNGVASAVRCGHEFFGTDHSLFGTDAPFSPDGGRSFVTGGVAAIAALDLDPVGHRQVLGGNAGRIFGLDVPGSRP